MTELTLSDVNKAIQEVLLNQSYETHGRKFTRASLESLKELRAELIAEERNSNDSSLPTLKKGAYRNVFT